MHTCFNYIIELKTDFILFQEFFVARDNIITISHFAFHYITSPIQNIRSRVMIFARK